MTLSFPIAVIDFEASSLEHDSYPIEVGVAISDGPDHDIRSWSTLIRPTGSWSVGGHWSKASQRVHGINRQDLQNGMSVKETMGTLNTFLQSIGNVYCDGGDYDRAWLNTLAKAAGIEPEFALCDLSEIIGPGSAVFERLQTRLKASPPPHRADPDARRLLGAIISAVTD